IMSLKFRQAFRATLLCCCSWARSRPKRRANRNSYTFKFHHRAAQANTHCSIVESSSSNTNNNVSNNNKQVANFTTPVLCCVVGNEAVSTQLEGRPLVGVVACESPRRHSYESNCYGPANNLPRML
ncbi:pyrokinin-1 receptor, partial [Biomphalaria glabrata]